MTLLDKGRDEKNIRVQATADLEGTRLLQVLLLEENARPGHLRERAVCEVQGAREGGCGCVWAGGWVGVCIDLWRDGSFSILLLEEKARTGHLRERGSGCMGVLVLVSVGEWVGVCADLCLIVRV